MKTNNLLPSIILLVLSRTLPAANLDYLQGCVVFLSGSVPVIENVQGTNYEVWYKNTQTGGQLPKRTPVGGSGFFLLGNQNTPFGSPFLFLATAKHVAIAIDETSDVTVRGPDNNPRIIKFADFLKPVPGAPLVPLGWVHHPTADCSIYPLFPASPAAPALVNAKAMPTFALPGTSDAPSRDVPLTTLGFALGWGTQVTFSPISKESRAASGLLSQDGVTFFFLQDPSIDGFSGAPVFESGEPRVVAISPQAAATISGPPKCWGVISRTDPDRSGGKMARVIHASYIAELIRLFESRLPSPPPGQPSAPNSIPSPNINPPSKPSIPTPEQ